MSTTLVGGPLVKGDPRVDEYQRRSTRSQYGRKFDVTPLLDFLEGKGYVLGREAQRHGPKGKGQFDASTRRKLYRWRQKGYVRRWSLDEFCINELGIQPELIYGDEWFREEADMR